MSGRLEEQLDKIIGLLEEIKNVLAKERHRDTRQRIVPAATLDPKQILHIYNELLGQDLGFVNFLTDKRKRLLAAMERHGLNKISLWEEYFRQVLQSPFLVGVNKEGWRANFDWLMNYNNYVKVMEGKYKRVASGVLPEPYRNAIRALATVSANGTIDIVPSAKTAEILADIHAAISMAALTGTAAHAALKTIIEGPMRQFTQLITSRTRLEDRQLAASIIYEIKRLV